MVRDLARRGARVACLAACVGAGTLAVPAFASAATVSVEGSTLHFLDDSGEYNTLQITDAGSQIRFIASRGTVTTSSVGCTVVSPGVEVDCLKAGVSRLLVDLGVGPDRVKNDTSIAMTANGGEDNDVLVGGSGDDTLNGGNDQDYLDGRGGADRMIGGRGIDFVSYTSRTHRLRVSLDGRANDGQSGERDNVRVEAILGGRRSDVLIGDPRANILAGGRGHDTLIGHGSRDQLLAGPGNDRLYGGNQNDMLSGSKGRDLLKGGNGRDQLNGGHDTSRDRLDCGANIDFAIVRRQDTVRRCEAISFRG